MMFWINKWLFTLLPAVPLWRMLRLLLYFFRSDMKFADLAIEMISDVLMLSLFLAVAHRMWNSAR
jgi:hypothetical protein